MLISVSTKPRMFRCQAADSRPVVDTLKYATELILAVFGDSRDSPEFLEVALDSNADTTVFAKAARRGGASLRLSTSVLF